MDSVDNERAQRILIAVGNREQLAILLAIAVPLARHRDGSVIPLHVTDADTKPTWFDIPAEARDVVVEPTVIKERNVSKGILQFAREREPDLLLVHWEGEAFQGRYLLGRTLDPVVQYAPCDVAVVRVREESIAPFLEQMEDPRRVLVPSGGGPNALLALDLALDLGSSAQVTALRVANQNLGHTAVAAQWQILNSTLSPWTEKGRIHPKVNLANDVADGIVDEAEREYDLVLIGATRERFVDRLLFGNLPQELTARITTPLIILRRHDPAAAVLRRARWRLIQILPQLTLEERIQVYRNIRQSSRSSTDFYVMMLLAGAIASLGLLLNSPAIVIGAMLVAPMLYPVMGVGLAIVQGDRSLLRSAMRTTLLAVLLVVGVSALLGLVIPFNKVTAEMLSRGSPTLIDLGVALISGAAAGYAISREDVASALPGVAIAVALVPPLATIGLAAAFVETRMMLGACLLVGTNLVAIISAVAILFMWMGFRPDMGRAGERARVFRGGLLGTTVLLVCVVAILGALTAKSFRQNLLRRRVQNAVQKTLEGSRKEILLTHWEIEDKRANEIQLTLSVQSPYDISPSDAEAWQNTLSERLNRQVSLSLTALRVRRFRPESEP